MTDAMTQPAQQAETAAPALLLMGSTDALVCEGDFCEIPQHYEQSVVNRRLDADEV